MTTTQQPYAVWRDAQGNPIPAPPTTPPLYRQPLVNIAPTTPVTTNVTIQRNHLVAAGIAVALLVVGILVSSHHTAKPVTPTAPATVNNNAPVVTAPQGCGNVAQSCYDIGESVGEKTISNLLPQYPDLTPQQVKDNLDFTDICTKAVDGSAAASLPASDQEQVVAGCVAGSAKALDDAGAS